MKKNFHNSAFRFLIFIFSIIFLIAACQRNNRQKTDNTQSADKPSEAYTDFLGAAEYEFNMIKNPVTGTVPEGIFEQERAQARAIWDQQQLNGVTSLNTYSFQGPNNLGGRTRSVVYDVRFDGVSNMVIIAGGVSGGIYKSIDNGATWVRKSPTGEHFSCTSIAQDTRVGFRDTWYYTVGEATGNSAGGTGAFYSGNGVYKSTDNGETWTRLTGSNTTALESFTVAQDYINKIIVDPTDGNIYIACPATIRRSTDAGVTWTTVISGTLSTSSQYTDIVVSSSGRLYCSFGGTNSSSVDGVWASAPGATSGDAGSWVQIAGAGAGGSPVGWNAEPGYGRVVLAIPPSAETLLYALYYIGSTSSCGAPFPEAELFRWDDVGGTWTDLSATLPDEAGCLSGNDPFAVQTGYDLVIAVKPDAPSTLFIGGTNAYRSTDAGLSWTRIGGYASPADYSIYSGSHPDIHAFAFQPGSPLIMLCGNDGGIQRTTVNTAATVVWTPINTGYRTYQYYYVTLDPRTSNDKVLGGAQDNGSTRNIGGVGTSFESVYGGDGVSVGLSDLISGSTYEYVGSQNGFINRRNSTSGLGFTTDITPPGESNSGLFVTLHRLDADNTDMLYYANDNALYRTSSGSTVTSGTWTSMTGVATAVGAANDISAMATTRGTYSAATASLFMGTSNGKVYRLDNPISVAAGTGPVDISSGSFPVGNVSSIAVNPRNDDTVIVTFSNYGITGNVWWSGNANTATPTWSNVEGNLPLPSYRSSAIAITSSGVEYFVGTSVGLYNAPIDGASPGTTTWVQDGASTIGNAVVSSLALRPADNKLLVGTHGYGMWYTTLTLSVVPVTLTEFKGTLQNKSVLLQWSTSTEFNTKNFELEKSFDGINFRKIATVAAAGNSNTMRHYGYADREPLSEKNYYRLRMFDLDGKNKLSNIVLIKLQDVQQDILVLGNPFKDKIYARLIKAAEADGELKLTDLNGRLVAKQSFKQGAQQIQFNLPAAKLSRGIYVLEAVINRNRFTASVLKE